MATPDHPQLNLLQRVDLELAKRIAAEVPPELDELASGRVRIDLPAVNVAEWVSGVLGLRGLVVTPEEVVAVLGGGESRFDPNHHEYLLIRGMARVFDRILDDRSRTPLEGWVLVDLFKEFAKGVARFRNNHIRRDLPWDAILFVDYPSCDKVSGYLDEFHRANYYTDLGLSFESLHPVRQAFRILWLFARIAPFPDFNLSMAWVAMNMYLVETGYPLLVPGRQDRERIHRMIGGPVPRKIIAFESRLLETLELG